MFLFLSRITWIFNRIFPLHIFPLLTLLFPLLLPFSCLFFIIHRRSPPPAGMSSALSDSVLPDAEARACAALIDGSAARALTALNNIVLLLPAAGMRAESLNADFHSPIPILVRSGFAPFPVQKTSRNYILSLSCPSSNCKCVPIYMHSI